jgi:circadian clock protein KaiB
MIAAHEAAYELTLFVSGASALSVRAIADATQLLGRHLDDRYHLSVVDVHDDAAAALRHGVLATPTLVKHRPLPVCLHVGGLSRTGEVLRALDLPGAPVASG